MDNDGSAAERVGMLHSGNELWLSTRRIRRRGDPDWDDYVRFVGLPHLQEVRTIDSWCNPHIDGDYELGTLKELWERLEMHMLPIPDPDREYYLLFTNALGANGLIEHPRLKLLGYDLSDETGTSSLLNCGRWQGVLEPIAKRTGENGLLTLEDAKLAQALLPEAWGRDPHSFVTVWELFEVDPGEPPGAESIAAADGGGR
jgi:hypothetical protein